MNFMNSLSKLVTNTFLHVLDQVLDEGISSGAFRTVRTTRHKHSLTYVFTLDEPCPITSSDIKKNANMFNGVKITSIRICNEVPYFLAGYNHLEGTNITKYQVWQNVLHKKIEELTGYKVKDLKKYGLSTMKPLETRGLLR